jgi:hypothetical protein
MNKRHPLMINRTDPPLAKGVRDLKGRSDVSQSSAPPA